MRLLGFFSNIFIAQMFILDIINFYSLGGLHIINNDTNRVFIIWFGFTTTFISSLFFINEHLNKNK